MVPTVLVLGVIAVELPVPPVATVYQFSVFPDTGVAESGLAVASWQ